MRSFPRLSLLYSTWASVVTSTGNVKLRLLHEVTSVRRGKTVDVTFREVEDVDLGQQVVAPKEEQREEFDELILCTDADAALQILGKDASWLEKRALGNVKVSEGRPPISVEPASLHRASAVPLGCVGDPLG